ncbi:hypothetical protein [Enterobacter roggenkampii]|uniref:hypothetical protein n=1 Tax=Enterobacter roggenkampii TaxID=1812935 RepID=UPI00214B023B|nr:hypothetical protein [Enterobacter roggenkampii]
MATNNFKAFALDPNANVTSQADWEALPALLSGFTSGKASSAQVNKAIRQASFIAAALAQYTANKSGQDVLDNGDLNGFIAKMTTAFGKDFQALDATLTALAGLATGANKLPYFTGVDTAAQTDLTSVGRDIIGKSTILDILKYLSLDRVEQRASETVIFSDNNKDKYLTSRSDNSWGYYNSTLNRFIPLPLSAGGTGVASIDELKNSLGLKSGAFGEVRTGAVAGTGNKTFSTPFPQGVVSGIAFCPVTSTGYMYSASVGSVSGSGFSFKPVYSSGGGNPIQAADGELFYYIAWGA